MPPMRTAACALLLLACAVPAAARAATPVLPGYWESNEKYSVLLSGGSHDRKCLTEQQITEFMAAPQTKRYRCVYDSHRVSGGQAAFRGGSCFSHSGKKVLSEVSATGAYAPESFHLVFSFNLLVSAGGLGLPGNATIDAHRISAECPVEPEPQAK